MYSRSSFRPTTIASITALVLIVWLLYPVDLHPLTSHAHPAPDYAAALARARARQALDSSEVNPVCRTQLFTHRKRSTRSIVLLHGFTNCPAQFVPLGRQFFDAGANVYIPRYPHHGLADRLTPDIANLTAEELATATDEALDIAAGLGEKVTVMGISSGAVAAAWAAGLRGDIDRAVVVAPAFGMPQIPGPLAELATKAALRLPNFFIWWDLDLKAAAPGPKHAYPRFATRALAQVVRLGMAAREQARHAPLAARSVVFVSNAVDPAVRNELAAALAADWRASAGNEGASASIERAPESDSRTSARDGGASAAARDMSAIDAAGLPAAPESSTRSLSGGSIQEYSFPANLGLIHDVIDTEQVKQRTDLVYPVLTKLAWGDD